jgi:hypothetical protein
VKRSHLGRSAMYDRTSSMQEARDIVRDESACNFMQDLAGDRAR